LTSELSGTTYGASAHQLRLSVTLLQNTIVKFGLSLRDPTHSSMHLISGYFDPLGFHGYHFHPCGLTLKTCNW